MPVVRISTGRFDPENYERVRKLLDESRTTLVPAIRALRGNRGYFVGIDRENNAISNVSIWDGLDDAMQMASLQPMLDLAGVFVAAGVRFDRPITNHQTLWTLQGRDDVQA
jgi:hypothetical protein